MIDTMHLSLEEDCLYRRLIDYYYMSGGPLDDNKEKLAKFTRLTRRKLALLLPNVLPYFERKNGKLHHKRIDEELQKSKEIQELRSNLGRKGGLAKAKQLLETNPSNSLSMPQPQPQPLNKQIRNKTDAQPDQLYRDMNYTPEDVIDLYHEMLPELITIKRLTPKLEANIRVIHQTEKFGCFDLQHWENFFRRVKRSNWLTGRAKGKPSKYSLRGLVETENYTKIAEGQYD
jgi:uncharacterized protein YdaU (DUF1376 family)